MTWRFRVSGVYCTVTPRDGSVRSVSVRAAERGMTASAPNSIDKFEYLKYLILVKRYMRRERERARERDDHDRQANTILKRERGCSSPELPDVAICGESNSV